MSVGELMRILGMVPEDDRVEIRTYVGNADNEQYVSADVCNVVSCCDGVVLIEAYS